jgi:site-specific recombinase XerD
MATLKYLTRTSASTTKNKLVPVYCRFVAGKDAVLMVKTGLFIKPDFFNNKSGTVRNIAEFKDKKNFEQDLSDLQSHIFKYYSELTTTPDRTWLINTIEKFHTPDRDSEKTDTLFSFIQDFIDKAPARTTPKTGNPVCYKQLREYERTFHYLKEFAREKKRKIDFEDITLDFYHDFIQYLQSEKMVTRKNGKPVKEPGLAKNTIGKKIQTLKIFLNAASDKGVNDNRQYKSHRFTAISEDTESIYLNEAELQSIYELDLSDNPCLDKVRDLFIIGCWTGLRYSDWNKVSPENIKDGFIELKQAKTGGAVVIPLHGTIEAIIQKYNGELPRVISNQKFNDYLKLIAKQAGLNERVHKAITKGGIKVSTAYYKHELVTTHTGRRSFATNLYKAGLPSLTIMNITGHKTEAAFLKYIKVTPMEHAQKLKEFWASRPQMKIV